MKPILLALFLTANPAITKDQAMHILDKAGMLATEQNPVGCYVGDMGKRLNIGCFDGKTAKLMQVFAAYEPKKVDSHIEVRK